MKLFMLLISLSSSLALAQGTMNVKFTDARGEFLSGGRGPWKASLGADPTGGSHATLWKTPAGFDSGYHTHTATYHAVVLEGVIENDYRGQEKPIRLGKGGYFGVLAGTPHVTKCVSKTGCVFFSVMDKPFDFIPQK